MMPKVLYLTRDQTQVSMQNMHSAFWAIFDPPPSHVPFAKKSDVFLHSVQILQKQQSSSLARTISFLTRATLAVSHFVLVSPMKRFLECDESDSILFIRELSYMLDLF